MFWGLLGVHLLDKETKLYSKPSTIRKLIGLLLILNFLLPIILCIPVALVMFVISIFDGIWGMAIMVFPLAILAMGFYSIPCWVIIDWDKNRVLSKLKLAKLNLPP